MTDTGASCPERGTTGRSRDDAPSPLTRDPGGWPDGRSPAGQAASCSEAFSVARGSDPVRLVLAGEIDMCDIPQLTTALADAVDGSGVLHVDMAHVEFCDLAGLRTIIGLSQDGDGQRPARRVVLHRLPTHVEKVLRILGWDTAPGVSIDNAK